jgi:hypothetical protein
VFRFLWKGSQRELNSINEYFSNEFVLIRQQLKERTIDMENISRGPTIGDFVTILTERSMQDVTVARSQIILMTIGIIQQSLRHLTAKRVQEYRLPLPPLLNVMC